MLGNMLENVRAKKPLVHCINNYVTANDCANLILACGASAIMADDPEEAGEIAALSDALVLNLGTPNPRKLEAMLRAGQKMRCLNRPVVLDPVGAGCSQMRNAAAQQIMQQVRPAAIRGNASEIAFLARGRFSRGGVEAEDVSDAAACAWELARTSGAVVVVSGRRDIVTDASRLAFVDNGSEMMRSVTGAGCMLSALMGAFLGANPDAVMDAALAAVCAMGLCGEIARGRMNQLDGNAGYRNYIIDAMFNLTGEQLEGGARYEFES